MFSEIVMCWPIFNKLHADSGVICWIIFQYLWLGIFGIKLKYFSKKSYLMVKNFIWKNKIFFSYLSFLSRTLMNHKTAGEGEGISLTLLYHFDFFHKYLHITQAITAESSPLHIASDWTRTGNLWFPSAIC